MTDRRPESRSLGAALWQWGRHRELPESADPIFGAAEMVYAALNGDPADKFRLRGSEGPQPLRILRTARSSSSTSCRSLSQTASG